MKKRYIYISAILLLLLFPVVRVMAGDYFTIQGKQFDEAWDNYHCYFLKTNQSGDNTRIPVFTFRNYVPVDINYDDSSSKPSALCWASSYDLNQWERFPIIQEDSCEAQVGWIRLDHDNDSRGGNCYDGGCQFYTYQDNWKGGRGDSPDNGGYKSNYPVDCMAGAMASDNGYASLNEGYMMIEAEKNSDVYSESDMNSIKNDLDSDFDDDTNFCFIIHHGGITGTEMGAAMFYYGHPYTFVDFYEAIGDGNHLNGTDDNGRGIVDLLNVKNNGQYSIYSLPSASERIDIEELENLDEYNFTDKMAYIVTKDGKLITDPSECIDATTEWLEQVYPDSVIPGMGWTDADRELMIADNIVTDDIAALNFEFLLSRGLTKKRAVEVCSSEPESGSSDYKCYTYTHRSGTFNPIYNTTVWTNKDLACGFKQTDWSYDKCKNAQLSDTYKNCEIGDHCVNITHSGYNGTADFVDMKGKTDTEIKCSTFKALHIIYRAAIIMAPILTIFFVTFDFVRSIISGDPKKVSKFRSQLIRRLIALLLLITIPIIVNILVGTLSRNDKIKDNSIMKCIIVGED